MAQVINKSGGSDVFTPSDVKVSLLFSLASCMLVGYHLCCRSSKHT